MLNLPGGPMVGVLPTDAEDTDSTLVREDPTRHRATTEAREPYSPCSATGGATAARSPSTTNSSPLPHPWQLEKAHTQQQRPSRAKDRINK